MLQTSFAINTFCFDFFCSGLWIMQIRSINYSLHFESVNMRKHRLYWKVFSTEIYRKFFLTVWCFFSFVCWSVDCISWVTKFKNFFLTCMEIQARFIFEALMMLFMESSFSTLRYSFLFFHLVCKLFKGLFRPLCQSENCIIWVFES